MKIAHISGHYDLTDAEFDEHYRPLIDAAIEHGDHFIVGDANGADLASQLYLFARLGASGRVRVFHMLDRPRHNAGFATSGGFDSDELRNEAMTQQSDYDIAWIRQGYEKAGTARNLERRRRQQAITDGKARGIARGPTY
jgi:hypothetical protein